jgi:dethiobiotin synthetase
MMNRSKIYAVFGNHTEAGKTVASAVIVQALQAAYWKPVQTGAQGFTDRQQILQWLPEAISIPEAYLLQHPSSPHYAAKLEGTAIDPAAIRLPKLDEPLVIETCGGALTPLTDDCLQADLYSGWGIDALLIVRHYLGGINHALLTMEALKSRGIPLKGLIYNGAPYPEAEKVITEYARAPIIGRLLPEGEISGEVVAKYAEQWKRQL